MSEGLITFVLATAMGISFALALLAAASYLYDWKDDP